MKSFLKLKFSLIFANLFNIARMLTLLLKSNKLIKYAWIIIT